MQLGEIITVNNAMTEIRTTGNRTDTYKLKDTVNIIQSPVYGNPDYEDGNVWEYEEMENSSVSA